ncbi:MAG TPA: tetratricopeptide repeat protein [Sedimentisphaerales bacterium]|nr:tetratricopeptide repeat protein [Sedimentisphaerales bacterium]
MIWTKRKKADQQAQSKPGVCPHCGAPLKAAAGKRQKKWHERTSVTLCVAGGLGVIALGFVHIITGVMSPYGLPFDIVRKDAFGYSETFVDARKIGALPYLIARQRYPLGCIALQKADYMPSGNVFETRTVRHLREDMSQWQAEFERAFNRPQQPWQGQLRGKIQILQTDPSDPNACNNRGIDAAGNAQYETAIAEFTRAVRRNPAFADAYYNRALVYAALGQLGQAVSDLTIVIEVKPEFAEAYRNRGLLQATMNQYDQAISDFTKVIELDPVSGEMYMRRSLALYARGHYEKAWEDVRNIQSLGLPVPAGFLESLRAASGR